MKKIWIAMSGGVDSSGAALLVKKAYESCAGVTLTTALVSALSGKKVHQDVAMTGEITLRGRVLPIGGGKEKLLAAYRAGVKTILLPKENKKDLEEVAQCVLDAIQITPVETVDQVLAIALVSPLPAEK